MADLTGPLGGGGGGGDELLRAAERAKQKAQETVAATEAAATDIVQLRKRLTDAQRRVLNALAEGTPSRTNQEMGVRARVSGRLRDMGLLESRLTESGALAGGYQLTDLGRQVANVERQAERAAETTTRQVTQAVARGARRGAARASSGPKLTPNTNPQTQRVMQDYINAVQNGLDAEAKVLREQLAKAGLVSAKQPVIGQAHPLSRSRTSTQNLSVPSMNSPAFRSGLAKAFQAPNFRFTPASNLPDDHVVRQVARDAGVDLAARRPRATVNLALPKDDPVRKQVEQAEAAEQSATRVERAEGRKQEAVQKTTRLNALQREAFENLVAGRELGNNNRASSTLAASLRRRGLIDEARQLTDGGRQLAESMGLVAQRAEQAQAAAAETRRVYHGTSVPFEGLPTRRPGAVGTFVSTSEPEAAAHFREGDYNSPHRRVVPMDFAPRNVLDATQFPPDYREITKEVGAGDLGWRRALETGRGEELRAAAMRRGYDAIKVSADNYIALTDDVLRAADQQATGVERSAERQARAADQKPAGPRYALHDQLGVAWRDLIGPSDRRRQNRWQVHDTQTNKIVDEFASKRAAAGTVRDLNKEAAATEQSEQRKTQAVEEGSGRRRRARKQEDLEKPVGGNASEFERILADRQDELKREVAAGQAYDRQVAEGRAPAPGTPEYERRLAEERAFAARGEAYRPGQGIIRHPTDFGRRVPGPIAGAGPAYGAFGDFAARHGELRPPVGDFAPVEERGRSRLQRARDLAVQAEVEASRSRGQLDDARRQLTKATGAEVAAAEQAVADAARQHDVNTARLRDAQTNVTSIRRENRANQDAAQAQAARTQALVEQQRRQQYDAPIGPERRPPGTELIRHPTDFGQRVPGPIAPGGRLEVPATPIEEINLSRTRLARDPRQRAATQSARDAAKADRAAALIDDRAAARLADDMETVQRSEQGAAQRSRELAEALRYQGTMLGATSTAWRRHGALTTEFIEAAARGEASYREWGYQIGATAAKFAGWTAVSIPVFAVLDGVRQVGQGAIQSASGVGALQRVITNGFNPDQLQSSFRGLARQFNVPMDTVVDAVFRSGQVFHNQADAVEAAKAALYSFQVGEVDVATSTKSLNAIVTGAGLSGQQLTAVFDQINQAQNRFGITIGDTEAGMARAAGSFTNAGGSLSYLLALLTTGQRVTGRTGENLGTAIQRSVGFIQRPTNQQQLRGFGIDPTAGVQSVYEQAFQRAQGLQGEELQRLATALSSPQYASYFVPILQNRDLFQRVQSETSPEASRGSAQQELGRRLGQVDEQIKRIGTNLQQLGSNLIQSGLLNGLGLMLKTLNGVLGVTNQVLEAFNQLPGPIRTAVTTMVQLRAVAAVGRRFNVGEALQGGRFDALSGFLVESPDRRANRLGGQALRNTATAAHEDQFRLQAASNVATRAAAAAERTRVAEWARIDQAQAAGLLDEAGALSAKADSAHVAERAHDRMLDATDRSRESLVLTAAAEDELADYQTKVAAASRRQRDAVGAQVLRENQVLIPPSRDRTFLMDAEVRRRIRAGADPLVTVAELGTIPPQARRVRGEARAAAAGAATGAFDQAAGFRENIRQLGVQDASSLAAANAARRAARQARELGTGARRVAGAMAGMGRSLLSMADPFTLAIGAAIAIPAIVNRFKQRAEQTRQAVDRLKTPPLDPAAFQRRLDEANRNIERYAPRPNQQPTALGMTEGERRRLYPELGPSQDVRAQSVLIRAFQRDTLRAVPAAQRPSTPVPYRFLEQITPDIDRSMQELSRGGNVAGRAASLYRKYAGEIRQSFEATFAGSQGGIQESKQALTYLAARFRSVLEPQSAYEILRSQNLTDIAAFVAREAQGIEVFGSNRQRMTRALLGYMAAAQKLATGGDPNDPARQQAFLDAQKGLDTALQNSVAGFQAQYPQATSRGGQLRVLRRALRGLPTDDAGQQALEEARAEREQALQQRRQARRARDRIQAAARVNPVLRQDVGPLGGEAPFPQALNVPGAQAQLQRARDNLTRARANARAANRTLRDGIRRIGATARDLVNAYASDTALIDAETRLANARTTDPVQQANNNLTAANRKRADLNNLVKSGRVKADQIKVLMLNAEADAAQAQADAAEAGKQKAEEAAQEQLAQLRAQGELAAAGLTGAAEVRARLGALLQVQGYMQAHRGQFKPSEFTDMAAQIKGARADLGRQLAQDARDLISARGELAASRTDNPVRQAQIESNTAERLLRYGRFETPAERMRAQADRNSKRRAAEQAVYDRRIENVEYEHDIGRLGDQAYISALQRIERTMKRGSEMRRQLHMRIGRLKHDLQNEGDLAIDLNGLKLPTAYEVRRAVRGAMQGTAVTQNYATTINVARNVDVAQVGATFDRYHRGSGKSLARAANDR